MKKHIPLLILNILIVFLAIGQNPSTIKGIILDEKTQEPLPYTNILVLQKYQGTISNESGSFSLDITDLSPSDTISFQYIGYKTKKTLLSDLDGNMTIYLAENLINLSEAFVYGNPPNPKDIIKKVAGNVEKNYKRTTSKDLAFMRYREINDIEKLTTDVKKNSISELEDGLIEKMVQKVPRHITSYTDFFGHVYFKAEHQDSLKITPKRTVSLKEIDIAEFEQFGKIFENLFLETEEKEYWKVKSGIFGQKIDMEDKPSNDSIEEFKPNNDSTRTKFFKYNVKYWLEYAQIQDSKEWEFLYKTGKYKYTLVGGTRVNGEDVYIIEFTPKGGGEYIGRVYIAKETYALVKADYEYAEGKTGTNIHLLGVGYTEDAFSASIYFEKHEGSYKLKYLSKKVGNHYSIDRSVALLKKKKRILFDKKLKEIKIGMNIMVDAEESIEVLFMDHQHISESQYANLKEAKKMKILYIDHFTDDLWKGYSIIEPTQRMREYQKQDVDWNQ